MSEKRYQSTCLQCGEIFIAKKLRTKFCSGKCRAKFSRDKKDKLVESQANIIKTQKQVAYHSGFVPEKPEESKEEKKIVTEKVSCEVGKDLTECKRPSGDHLYTDQDLWILIAKINKIVFAENSDNMLSVMDTDRRSKDLIHDFERRFDCRFSDVKRANSAIRPGKTNEENYLIIERYSRLEYSR